MEEKDTIIITMEVRKDIADRYFDFIKHINSFENKNPIICGLFKEIEDLQDSSFTVLINNAILQIGIDFVKKAFENEKIEDFEKEIKKYRKYKS